MRLKNCAQAIEAIPEKLLRKEDDSLARFAKGVGIVALTLVAVGMIANLPDIKRYVRMTMM
jgi:hypothetical protein